MSSDRIITIAPCDRLNPGFGYQLTIEDSYTGEKLLRTSVHSITGKDLTLKTALELALAYGPPGTGIGIGEPRPLNEPLGDF